jgi:hypothetical protein
MTDSRPGPVAIAAALAFALSGCLATGALALDSAVPPGPDIEIRVTDANGAPLPLVALMLRRPDASVTASGISDDRGRCRLPGLGGDYLLDATREGFFPLSGLHASAGNAVVVIALVRRPAYAESIDVVAPGLGGEVAGASVSSRLLGRDVIDLPFAGARDYRRALSLLPGVIEDAGGQLHVGGAEPQQLLFQLDGFDVGDPATGMLRMRLSPEGLRALDVQRSRFSAEHGRGSAGVISLETVGGGDRFKVSATDFLPSITRQQGIRLGNWTPRLAWSGPLWHRRAWFSQAVEGEYDRTLVADAPAGANARDALRVSHIAKLQIVLAPRHIVTASLLWNLARSDHEDLTRFDPIETTVNRKTTTFFIGVRDQFSRRGGTLYDVGLAVQRVLNRDQPLGAAEYVVSPGATSGNFYRWSERRGDRLQALARMTLPVRQWHGQHQLRFGVEAKPTAYIERVQRRPITVLDADGRLLRTIEYVDAPEVRLRRIEADAFVQDRWSLAEHAVLELGLRSDWDSLSDELLLAPRAAVALGVGRATRLSAGVGLFYDAIPMDVLALPLTGRRTDVFFSSQGEPLERVATQLTADDSRLRVPSALNWSLGVERRLARGLLASLECHARRGKNGLTFLPPGAVLESQEAPLTVWPLNNWRRDRYDGVELGLRHSFRGDHTLSLSYVWSHARTNTALDFDLDTPVLGAQAPASLAWDARHRLLSHGFLPLSGNLDLSFTLEWRSGFPFSLTNQEQALVERPNSRRLPAYFALNLHLEQRLRLFGARWAVRVGANDLTNRANAGLVDPNVDSPTFLAKDRTQQRGFVGRLRFLGRR